MAVSGFSSGVVRGVGLLLPVYLLGRYGFSWDAFAVAFAIATVLEMGWIAQQKARRTARRNLTIKYDDFELKEYFKDGVPSWFNDPDIESVAWFNLLLERLWPSIAAALSNTVKNAVNPILENATPAILAGLELRKFDVGNLPPAILGAKAYQKSGPGEAVVDLDLGFATKEGSGIILRVNGHGGIHLDVELEDVFFKATLRVMIQDIGGLKLPCFRNLGLSFVKLPHISFALNALGGDVTLLPGVEAIVQNILANVFNNLMLWPQALNIQIGEAEKDTEDAPAQERPPLGLLQITLVEASNLFDTGDTMAIGVDRLADPYATMQMRGQEVKSKVVENDLNPKYDQVFKMNYYNMVDHLTVWFRDYDPKIIGKSNQHDETIGHCYLSLQDLHVGDNDVWIDLQPGEPGGHESTKLAKKSFEKSLRGMGGKQEQVGQVNHGRVHFNLRLMPFNAEGDVVDDAAHDEPQDEPATEQAAAPTPADQSKLGTLKVTVHRAQDLVQGSFYDQTDPFVQVEVEDKKEKTKVLSSSVDPTWEETFTFVVDNAESAVLNLTVMDKKTFSSSRVLGKVSIPVAKVREECLHESKHRNYSLANAKSGSLELTTTWFSL